MDVPAASPLPVTTRERAVLEAISEHASNAEIALRLGIAPRTVESHVSALLRKLGARDRADLRRLVGLRPAPEPSSLPAMVESIRQRSDMFGRRAQLDLLVRSCTQNPTNRLATLALITGEPGIGKSRLAAEVAAVAHRRGVRVLYGACLESPSSNRDPIAEALDRSVTGRRPAGATDRSFHDDDADPDRAFEIAVAGVTAGLADVAREPTLLVVDDLQWATAVTRAVLTDVLRSVPPIPVAVLATVRDRRPDADAATRALLMGLRRSPQVTVVELAGIDVAAAAELVTFVGGSCAVDVASAVLHTGGNPLFLREVAKAGLSSRTLAEFVQDRIDRAVGVDELLGQVLDVVAVLGDSAEVAVVAAVTGLAPADVADALTAGVECGLLVQGGSTSFSYAHSVFRSVRYDVMHLASRCALHAEVAAVLHDLGRIDDAVSHRCIAASLGGSNGVADAIARARVAGDLAAQRGDHVLAARHYRAALDLVDLPGAAESDRTDLRIRLGRELILTGEPGGRDLVLGAARSAVECDDAIVLADALAALEPIPGGSTTVDLEDPEFVELATAALERLPDTEVARRVRVLAALGMQLTYGAGDPRRGDELVREAVATARQLGDPVALGNALLALRFCGGPFDVDAQVSVGEELVGLGDRHAIEAFATAGRQQQGWCARVRGDVNAMTRWYDDAARHLRCLDADQLAQHVVAAYLVGDLDEADRRLDALEALTRTSGLERAYAPIIRLELIEARGHELQLDDLEPSQVPRYAWLGAALRARTLAAQGRTEEARDLLETACWYGLDEFLQCGEWTLVVAWWSEVAVRASHVSAAATLLERLEPFGGWFVESGPCVHGTVDWVRARLALTVGDPVRAIELAAVAVEASRSRRTPVFLGRELVVLAAARRATGASRRSVHEPVAEALSIAERTGAHRIRLDAMAADLDGGPLGPAGCALTEREEQIVGLVAEGATNKEIAYALGISAATVRKHLEHAFAKLGASTRTAAVAQLARIRAGQ